MKKLLTLALFIFVSAALHAQSYPLEWKSYTSDKYFHDVESGVNDENLPETRFMNNLLDIARANLAKQIQVKVQEVSQMQKNVVNGNADIRYSSQRSFSTDVDMRFSQSKNHVDMASRKVFVIVYINKEDACRYYENDINMLIGQISNSITIADNYINTGFKSKAQAELNNALTLFGKSDEMFFWMNVYGMPDYRLQQYQDQLNQKEQQIKAKLGELEYGTTYCVVCTADNFGKSYPKLKNEVKGDLSASGCNFTDDPATADYVIYIEASAREYNTLNGAYFTYVDAVVAIDKKATGQRIFEDEISVKGSHTFNYEEAGRDGYKKIRKDISNMLKENIKL